MSKKVLVLLVYMFFVGFESIFAQGSTISGNVADNQGVPLPGINILEKGTDIFLYRFCNPGNKYW